MDTYETSKFITAQLDSRGIKSEYWYTGGGCTAIKIVMLDNGVLNDGVIVITDQNASVNLTEAEQRSFIGWAASYYPDEDAELYGDHSEHIHAEVYGREKKIHDAQLSGGARYAVSVAEALRVNWQADTITMADAIATFIADVRENRK